MNHFPRPSLAKSFSDDLFGRSPMGDASNGMFLAAPEGTGKSNFLTSDLKPELESRGALVLYCNLQSNNSKDSALPITETIISALSSTLSGMGGSRPVPSDPHRTPENAGRDSPRVAKVSSLTIADALRAVAEISRAPISLIIDEAQEALNSNSCASTMIALKSARDQLNQRGKIQLMIVMAGSDRDKLQRLVQASTAPFFGSRVQPMPFLGNDFVAYLGHQIEQQRPVQKQVDQEKLQLAFSLFGYRPMLLMTAVGEVLNPLNYSTLGFEDALLRAATQSALNDELKAASMTASTYARS